MKKVLFVATVVKGHIEAFHLPYLEWFKNNGYETHVCAKNDYDNKEDCNIPHCDSFFDLPFERSPFKITNVKVLKQLKKLIDTYDYDLIHCHTPMGGVLTRIASRLSINNDTKVIYTAHGFHFYKGGPIRNWLMYYPIEKWLSRYTDVLITINEEDYNLAKKLKAKKVEYVPGIGVDIGKFGEGSLDEKSIKKNLGVSHESFVLLSVGELSNRKNHKAIIKALGELKNYNIVYLISGEGDLDKYLKDLAAKLNVKVKFLGFRRDIPDLCSVTDLFVFPSYQEGLSAALMEAMSAKLPIVCSDIRGNRDLITQETGGFLIKPDNINGYSHAIEKMIKDVDLRVRMGKHNQEEVKKYGRNAVMNRMKNIYNEALKS